jgi:hypothetical protein
LLSLAFVVAINTPLSHVVILAFHLVQGSVLTDHRDGTGVACSQFPQFELRDR